MDHLPTGQQRAINGFLVSGHYPLTVIWWFDGSGFGEDLDPWLTTYDAATLNLAV
jgi:hypothetical protein